MSTSRAADLIEDVHYLEDTIADLFHIRDPHTLSRILEGRSTGRRFVPYVLPGSPLEEQRVQGADETTRLINI